MNIPYYNDYPEASTVRELVSMSSTRFNQGIAYSYRQRPSDPEAVRVTFRRFAYDVKCLGTAELERGMAGVHCALIGKLSYNWVLCYTSLLSIGAVLVPLDRDWSAEDLADTVKKADCKFLICDGDLSEKAEKICEAAGIEKKIFMSGDCEEISSMLATGATLIAEGDDSFYKAPIDPNALALLVFTSGTTGKGKGVMLTQKAILSNVADALKMNRWGKKMVAVLPPHHTFGSTVGILAVLCCGVENYISSGIRYLLGELKAEKPDMMVLVPLYLETFKRKILSTVKEKKLERVFSAMLSLSRGAKRVGVKKATDKLFSSVLAAFGGKLKLVVCGGAPLNEDVLSFFNAMGITVLNGYGITECSPLISVNRVGDVIPGSVGSLIPSDRLKIEVIGDGDEGEICVTGPNVMLGYYKDEAATAACMDGDGYFHTGDIGRVDDEGHIYITGRLKNLIILSNGKNVYPEEIENVLSTIPGVMEMVVYEGQSRRGAQFNSIVAEFYMDPDYVKDNGISDVKRYLQTYTENYNRTAVPYKKIDLIRVRQTEFPKNTLRKILRFKLDRTID